MPSTQNPDLQPGTSEPEEAAGAPRANTGDAAGRGPAPLRGSAGNGTGASSPSDDFAFYFRALVGQRARIALFTLGAAAGSLLLALMLPRYYTADVVLLPTEKAKPAVPAQLSGLATTFGLQFPFDPVNKEDMYPPILTSDRLLGNLLDAPVPGGDTPTTSLLEILAPEGPTDEERRARAIRHLRRRVVRAYKNFDTRVVTLEVTTLDPELSVAIADRLVTSLEDYLVAMRRSEGSQNSVFIRDRILYVREDLGRAEETLRRFRETNRRIGNSPELLLHEERLTREIALREQLFLELQGQLEAAKIEESKSTRILRVLDQPSRPDRPSRPHRPLFILAGGLLGLFGVMGWGLIEARLRISGELREIVAPLAEDMRRLRGVRPPMRTRRES